MKFQKAIKSQSKLRLAIFGPSGSGKTYSALRIATGLGGNIALIDTERGSASLYADRFSFDVLDLDDRSIRGYVDAISLAEKNGYGTLIIDSLSHGWQELLEDIDRIAKAKYRGNSWSAWQEGTPKQRKLVDSLLNFDGHIIATMRSKTEWATETDDRGKNKPVRIGLAPEQGKGIEYEFTILMELGTEHVAHVIKDRTGKYQDQLIDKPSEQLGKELLAWLNTGEVKPIIEDTHIEAPTVPEEEIIEEVATKNENAEAAAPSVVFAPEESRKKILEAAAKKNKEVTPEQLSSARSTAMHAIRDMFGEIPEEQRDTSVSMVLDYIFGSKELSYGDCVTLRGWAYRKRGNELLLKESSIKEAHAILLKVREEQVSTDELTEVEF